MAHARAARTRLDGGGGAIADVDATALCCFHRATLSGHCASAPHVQAVQAAVEAAAGQRCVCIVPDVAAGASERAVGEREVRGGAPHNERVARVVHGLTKTCKKRKFRFECCRNR